ncbi:hypothetical protein [Mesorhizobium sp. B2-4-19]|uniref:hypothetical protein n=1 Tax=Mesorhizobium sp. B2-4-19 TaxID=2589930 RepID=UPI001FF045A3|nr:hypothetical protein [Mesorhizobium sp. B2-4-19]
MLRKANCDKLPDEATCGRLAKTGFNDCIASGKDHKFCTREFTKTAGLRACDKAHPCREDYICTAGYDDLPRPSLAKAPASRPISSSSSASTATPEAGYRMSASENGLPQAN